MTPLELLAVSDSLKTALIVAGGGLLTAILVGWQTNRSKREDYRRQDEVAAKAEAARVELVAENKRVADEAFRQQAEVAATAAQAAQLLLEAQSATTEAADEVARVAADQPDNGGSRRSKLLAVVIAHPSGYRREVLLDAVPAVGEHVLLRNAPAGSQPSQVCDVLWVEANGEPRPSVVIVVRAVEDDPGKGLMKAAADAE